MNEDICLWGFWGFLGTVFTGLVAILKLLFVYIERAQRKQAELDISVDGLKDKKLKEFLTQLQNQVKIIIPVINRHEEVVQNLQKSVDNFMSVETGMLSMTKKLDQQFLEFNRVVPNINTSINAVVDDIYKIKTEIIKLRDDYLFIKTKKEKL